MLSFTLCFTSRFPWTSKGPPDLTTLGADAVLRAGLGSGDREGGGEAEIPPRRVVFGGRSLACFFLGPKWQGKRFFCVFWGGNKNKREGYAT